MDTCIHVQMNAHDAPEIHTRYNYIVDGQTVCTQTHAASRSPTLHLCT